MKSILDAIKNRRDLMAEGDHYDIAVQALLDAGYTKVADIAYPDEIRGAVYRTGQSGYARVDCGEFLGVFTNLEFSDKPFDCKLVKQSGDPSKSPQKS